MKQTAETTDPTKICGDHSVGASVVDTKTEDTRRPFPDASARACSAAKICKPLASTIGSTMSKHSSDSSGRMSPVEYSSLSKPINSKRSLNSGTHPVLTGKEPKVEAAPTWPATAKEDSEQPLEAAPGDEMVDVIHEMKRDEVSTNVTMTHGAGKPIQDEQTQNQNSVTVNVAGESDGGASSPKDPFVTEVVDEDLAKTNCGPLAASDRNFSITYFKQFHRCEGKSFQNNDHGTRQGKLEPQKRNHKLHRKRNEQRKSKHNIKKDKQRHQDIPSKPVHPPGCKCPGCKDGQAKAAQAEQDSRRVSEYRELLGVSASSTNAEIRKAYLRLSRL